MKFIDNEFMEMKNVKKIMRSATANSRQVVKRLDDLPPAEVISHRDASPSPKAIAKEKANRG